MKPIHHQGLGTAALLLFGAVALSACGGDESPTLDADGCSAAPAAAVDTAVCRGKANFHDRTLAGLGGNGRACSDCHMESQNFQLTPAAAQARFAQMAASGVDDPLFRAIDADDFRVNGAAAHDFTNLTQNGLIRVTIPLPANLKLLDCGSTVPCPASAQPTSRPSSTGGSSIPGAIRDCRGRPAQPDGFDRPSRSTLRRTNATFAGRSARRRMKYGYHCVPNGT